MGRFILSKSAEADLREIIAYIAQRSPLAAKRVKGEFRAAMRRLAEFRGLGHVRDDCADESLRFWSLYSYLIVYRAGTKPLDIARVLHGARGLGALGSRQ